MSKPIFISCLLLVLLCTNLRSQEISMDRDRAPLKDLLLSIHEQTGYFFYYSSEDLATAKPVSLHVRKTPLEQVLEICFAGQPLSYEVRDRTIVVRRKAAVAVSAVEIKGKVLNEDGDPIQDASVQVQGTSRTIATNAAGEFSFEQLPEDASLQFSHIGYQGQIIPLAKNRFITVILKRSTSRLDEVQVIAYGTTTRRLNTGNVSTITRETLEQQPVSNPLQALEGRVSGVVITQQTGMPGGAINIQIRGQSSLRAAGNNPFYIIDGVPYTSTSISSIYTSNSTLGGNPLNEINPTDIERIEILKDADATAIYGSRGANGVILITTRKGREGKLKLTLDASTGIGQVARRMPLLNTTEYLAMRHEAFANDGMQPGPYDFDLNSWDTTRNTDWQKTLIGGSARLSNIQLSLSGGTQQVQYLVSTGFEQQGTVFPGNLSEQKIPLHLALNTISGNKKFRMGFTAGYVLDNNQLSSFDLTSNAITTIPDAPPVYDSAGKLSWNGYFDNPYGYLLKPYASRMNNLISNLQISYQILNGLQFVFSGGYNNLQSKERTANPVSSFSPVSGISSGSATFAQSSLSSWILEPQVIYDRHWGSLKLNALLGTTFQENKNEGQSLSADGYSNDLLLGTLAGAAQISLLTAASTQYRYQAVFGRLNAQWKEKFLLNLTGRRDGSSRFGPGKQFADFGSVGAAWIFTKESLFKHHLPGLSFGKIRLSYGSTGNDQIGDYGFLSRYGPTPYTYQGVSGLYALSLFNADYSWEINRKMEIGLDLGFFHDRLLISAVAFRNRSSNQLIGRPLPLITGFSSIQANLPATVQNRGIELEISSVNIHSGSFTWRTSFNLTVPQNKLIDFPGLKQSAYSNLYEIGKPLSVIKAFHFTGVDPGTGIYQFASAGQGGQSANPDYPGDLRTDKSITQSFYGGLLNTLQFHGFQLDLFIQFVKQTGYNYRSGSSSLPGMQSNQPVYVLDRWQQPGDLKPSQRYSQDYNGEAYAAFSNISSSDLRVSDASFLRLKNVSLSYSLAGHWMESLHLTTAKIFFRGQNLLTLTSYQGLDPETQSVLRLPPLRIWTVGLQCSL